MPQSRPWLQFRQVLLLKRAQLDLSKKRRPGRIVKRANHCRHVPEWRAFDPPLSQWTRGFTLKIDENEVFARVKDLPQVKVAMAAYSPRAHPKLIYAP